MAAGLFGATQGTAPKIAARDAKKFVGKQVTICGRVVAYDCTKSNDAVFLNLDKPYWSGELSIAIRAIQRPAFGQRFEEQYLWADVCATGRVDRVEGRYALVVDAPGSLVRQSQQEPPVTPFAPGAVQSCTPEIEQPTLRHEVKPDYTRDGMRGLIEGRMLLDAVVLPDGTVGDVRVVHSLDQKSGLDAQGVKAVKQWRFVPGNVHGSAIPVIVQIELWFRLT